MKRIAVLLVATVLAATPVWSQTPPASPEPPKAPAPPGTPVAPKADPNVRRHRMGAAGHKIDVDEQVQAALEKHIATLRKSIAELEAQVERTDDAETRAQLEALKEQLEALDTLEIPTVPDVVILDPDRPGSLLPNDDGSFPVIVDPEGRARVKSRGEKVTYFHHLYINHDDWVDGPAVAILGNVYVEGHVDEDVISIGGNVYVEGTVSGNVVAPFGDVYVGQNAEVEGDVLGVSVTSEDEASIGGTIEEIPLFRLPWVNEGPQALLKLAATAAIAKILFSLLFGWLTLALAPNHVTRVSERLKSKPAGSFFAGVLVQILTLPVFVLLLVTVVGIPLAVLALPLVLIVACLLGFVACSRMVGENLLGKDSGRPAVAQFLTGALILCAPLGLASIAALGGSEMGDGFFIFVNLMLFVGLCLLYIVYTAGLGAAIFSRLGTRPMSPPRVAPSATGPLGMQTARTALPQAPPAADMSST